MGAIHDGSAIIYSNWHTFNLWGFAWNDYYVKLPNKTVAAATRRVTSCGQLVRNELSMFINQQILLRYLRIVL